MLNILHFLFTIQKDQIKILRNNSNHKTEKYCIEEPRVDHKIIFLSHQHQHKDGKKRFTLYSRIVANFSSNKTRSG